MRCSPDALDRLLPDPSAEQGSILLSSVRKDPFAVVLLDEFEKPAAPIWDLFLELFDDGRLTDQQGRTADFRRSIIIILTSNVGSALAHRPGRDLPPVRASGDARAAREGACGRALEKRLRTRPKAVELDESAIEFLIAKGFSPDLGGRPLKRAVDRHVLAQIARPIVEQAVPEGDQFLLVSAGPQDLEHLYAVSGLGAGTILAPEAGLHVLEIPEQREGSRAERVHAIVQVASRQSELRAPAPTNVVRRYRAEPTPLVRDAVRGYRTGRFDRVLAGDFDLF